VDATAAMAELARARCPDADVRVGTWDALPFGDGEFDLVTCSLALCHATDVAPPIREMARVLRPGGSIVMTDWCDDYLACRICNLYLRLTNRAFYRTYRERECVELFRQAGFQDVRLERYKINWLWGLMTARVAVPG